MPATCITGCAAGAATTPEAGLHLGLCSVHLAALRRTCKGKQALTYAKLAAREAARLVAAGASHRPGRTPVAYRCPICFCWHVGHQPHAGAPVDPAAAAAAAAVHSHLTPAQVTQLTEAWRTQARPGRRKPRPVGR